MKTSYLLNSTDSSVTIVVALILDQDPIGNPGDTGPSIKLGLNFNQVKTNSAMTHLLVLDDE
jgi:hypothetical protein